MESMNLVKDFDELKSKILFSSRLLEPEEEERNAWNKQTMQWYINNLSKVKKQVAYMAKDLNASEVELVTSNLGEYLEKGKDWGDIEDEDNHLTLEQYVYKGANFCIKRYKHEKCKENAMRALPIVTEDDEEKNALDLIGDTRLDNVYDDICCNFDEALEQMQYKRFFYGIDIYNVLYMASLVKFNHNNENYETMLNAFGISRKELQSAYKKAQSDEDFTYLLTNIKIELERNISYSNILQKIGKYVYGRKRIYEALKCFC